MRVGIWVRGSILRSSDGGASSRIEAAACMQRVIWRLRRVPAGRRCGRGVGGVPERNGSRRRVWRIVRRGIEFHGRDSSIVANVCRGVGRSALAGGAHRGRLEWSSWAYWFCRGGCRLLLRRFWRVLGRAARRGRVARAFWAGRRPPEHQRTPSDAFQRREEMY
jgi:hypothetical protein